MKLINTLINDKTSLFLVTALITLNIGLYLLWRFLIQSDQLPIYSPIKIFPVQFSLLLGLINGILAAAISTKSIRTSHLLLSTAAFVSILCIIMVIYSYNFFKI